MAVDYTQENVLATFMGYSVADWLSFENDLDADPMYAITSRFSNIPPRFLQGFQLYMTTDYDIWASMCNRNAVQISDGNFIEYEVIIEDITGEGTPIPGITISIDIKWTRTLDPILSWHFHHTTNAT